MKTLSEFCKLGYGHKAIEQYDERARNILEGEAVDPH